MTSSFYLTPLVLPPKTKAKARSNASNYPLFIQLSSLIEDPFWQTTFSKIGMDVIPSGFSIRQDCLTSRRNNKTFKLQLIINNVNDAQGLRGLNPSFLPLLASTDTKGFIDVNNVNINVLSLITPTTHQNSNLATPSVYQNSNLATPSVYQNSNLATPNFYYNNSYLTPPMALATPLTYNINLNNNIPTPVVNASPVIDLTTVPILELASVYLSPKLLQQNTVESYLLQAFILSIIRFFKDYGGLYSPNDYKRFSNNQLKQSKAVITNWSELDKANQKQLMEQFFCREVSKLPYDNWQQEYAKTQLLLYYYYGNISSDQIVFERGQIQSIIGLNLAEGLPIVMAPKKSRSATAKPIEDPLVKHWKKYWSMTIE